MGVSIPDRLVTRSWKSALSVAGRLEVKPSHNGAGVSLEFVFVIVSVPRAANRRGLYVLHRLHGLHRLHELRGLRSHARRLQAYRLLEANRVAELPSQRLQISPQAIPRLYRLRAQAAGVHIGADALREAEHFIHRRGQVAIFASGVTTQTISRTFKRLHVVVVVIRDAIQTSERTSEVLFEIIRVPLDILGQAPSIAGIISAVCNCLHITLGL